MPATERKTTRTSMSSRHFDRPCRNTHATQLAGSVGIADCRPSVGLTRAVRVAQWIGKPKGDGDTGLTSTSPDLPWNLNPTAWRDLVDQLQRFAWRFGPIADEVVGCTLLKICKRKVRRSFDSALGSRVAFVCGIAVRTAAEIARKEHRRQLVLGKAVAEDACRMSDLGDVGISDEESIRASQKLLAACTNKGRLVVQRWMANPWKTLSPQEKRVLTRQLRQLRERFGQKTQAKRTRM